MNSKWLVLIVGVVAIGCTEENSNSGGIDANGATDASVIDATVLDAGSAPDADGFCEFVPTPVMPFPEPTIVAPGTACVGDDDCTLVGGFCRPLSAGGSECATFQGNTEPCGGLTAPAEQQRCLPALSCDAVNAQTMGTCVCTPNCVDKVCGSDGCGSTCGDCDEVCAAEGTVCNDFEGDQCCRPAVVTQLPYERVGNTEGAEDTFDVPNIWRPNQPDEIIRFTPPVSGEYFVWGDCHEAALYSSCGDSSSQINMFNCTENDFEFVEPVRFQFDAEREYFFAEEGFIDNPDYIRRIHGPITSIANLASSRVFDIVTDNTHVYWSDATSVFRHAIDGTGATTTILTSSANLVDIETFGDNIYAVDGTSGLILKAPKMGGTPTILASGQTGANALTVSAGYLYWAIPAPAAILCIKQTDPIGAIRRIPLQGGVIEDIATNQLAITDIDSDENHVYWTSSDSTFSIEGCQTGSVQRRNHAGGAIETFADSLSYSRIVVGETDIYIAYQHYRHNVGDIYDWSRYSKNTLELAHTFDPVHEAADASLDSSGFYLTGSYGNVAGGVFKSSELGAPIGLVPSFIYNRTQIATTQGRLFLNFDDEIISVPLP